MARPEIIQADRAAQRQPAPAWRMAAGSRWKMLSVTSISSLCGQGRRCQRRPRHRRNRAPAWRGAMFTDTHRAGPAGASRAARSAPRLRSAGSAPFPRPAARNDPAIPALCRALPAQQRLEAHQRSFPIDHGLILQQELLCSMAGAALLLPRGLGAGMQAGVIGTCRPRPLPWSDRAPNRRCASARARCPVAGAKGRADRCADRQFVTVDIIGLDRCSMIACARRAMRTLVGLRSTTQNSSPPRRPHSELGVIRTFRRSATWLSN
jgi:hypothetical protein